MAKEAESPLGSIPAISGEGTTRSSGLSHLVEGHLCAFQFSHTVSQVQLECEFPSHTSV